MIHQFPHAKRLSRVWARRFSTGCRSAAVPQCRGAAFRLARRAMNGPTTNPKGPGKG
jgi:hypothetical protein